MSINKQSYKDIVNNINSDIISLLPDIDPTIFGSFTRAFVEALAGRSFDHIQLFNQLERNLFPQTADGEFLENVWAAYEGIVRYPATQSKGLLNIPANVGATVPISTEFVSLNSNSYTTDNEYTAVANISAVSSLTRVGSTITVITTLAHNYGSGITVTIVGADQSDYNGDFVITVLSDTEFTYEKTSSQSVTGTGTITSTFDGIINYITSSDTETEEKTVNLENGSQLSLVSPIAGVENISFVNFDGITGGIVEESDKDLLNRVSQSRSNPVANFNVARIEKTAYSIPGVTRVLVKRIHPAVGDVTILFMRDNDPDPFPAGEDVDNVKNAILEYLPATSNQTQVYVQAPIAEIVDFTFTALSPNTTEMKDAIVENLKAFFQDEVTFEQNVSENLYKSAIASTIDIKSGEKVSGFTLSSPIGDILVPVDSLKIASLGTVTFTV
jgi:uncharacterized phage protein gp47/JayE